MESPDLAVLKHPSGTREGHRNKFISITKHYGERLSREDTQKTWEVGLQSREQKDHVPVRCRGGCKGELCLQALPLGCWKLVREVFGVLDTALGQAQEACIPDQPCCYAAIKPWKRQEPRLPSR